MRARPAAAAIALLCAASLALFSPRAAATDAGAICQGRYATATEMLDVAYGKYETLYSGGDHHRTLDHIGATIDLYRLWRGMPDLHLRRTHNPFDDGDDPLLAKHMIDEAVRNAMPRVLHIVNDAGGTALTEEERYIAATAPDFATSAGPVPDWWVADAAPASLSPLQQYIRDLARTAPFIDWAQTVLAASSVPWAHAWYLTAYQSPFLPAYRQLADRSYGKFERGEGIEWLIAGAMLTPYNDDTKRIPDTGAWSRQINDCTATPAIFAAYAIIRLELLRQGDALTSADRATLPTALYKIAFRNKAMLATLHGGRKGNQRDELLALTPDKASVSWLNVGRTYHAKTIGELLTIHDGVPLDKKTVRALNLLSVDHLLQFAQASKRSPEERRQIYVVAFCRLVALGQTERANALIGDLLALFPEERPKLEKTAAKNWPLDVRMALIALELPEASVWLTAIPGGDRWSQDYAIDLRAITKYGIDLPSEFRTASFLQRDLEVWLQAPKRWRAYYTMKGASIDWIDRASRRKGYPVWSKEQEAPKFLPDHPAARQSLPFAQLIAWNEIINLGPRQGLSRRISLYLINWAQQSPDNRFLRLFWPTEAMANGLKTVIRFYRQNDMGLLQGRPIGQTAYKLLHKKFPGSQAAATTPYWYRCTHRCEK